MENTQKDRKGAGEFFWRVFVKRKRTRVHWSFEGFEDSLKPSNWSADCQVYSLRFCYCCLHFTALDSLVVSENLFLLFGVDAKGHSLFC